MSQICLYLIEDIDQAWWTDNTWGYTECQSHGLTSIMVWILSKYHDPDIGGLGTEDGPVEDEVLWWVDLLPLRVLLVKKRAQLDKVRLANLDTHHHPPTRALQARQLQGTLNLLPLQHCSTRSSHHPGSPSGFNPNPVYRPCYCRLSYPCSAHCS